MNRSRISGPFAIALAAGLAFAVPTDAKGGGQASRGSARSSVNSAGSHSAGASRSGSASRSANVNQNTNRNTNVNSNTNVNRNTNINSNTNVNINRDVDIDNDCCGCCYHDHPVAAAAAVGTAMAVTAAAIGSVVNSVPPSCVTVVSNNVSYLQCGSTWYQPQYVGTSVSYVVVNAP